jgi:long-subunit fatty acid transport protein
MKSLAVDFIFGAGVVYKQSLSEMITASLGVVYDFGTELNVTRSQTIQIKTNSNIPIRIDTLLDDASGYLQIPDSYGLGFTLNRQNNWTFGADVRLQNWSEYKDFDGNNDNLKNTLLIKIGGEITPNASSVDSYFERVTFRLGLNVDQTPYSISNTQIDEIGINFGLSLPVSNFSSVDMGFKYGSRGTLDNNLIKENFFRVYFGVTFNDNRWFIRPKYN